MDDSEKQVAFEMLREDAFGVLFDLFTDYGIMLPSFREIEEKRRYFKPPAAAPSLSQGNNGSRPAPRCDPAP